MTITRFLSILSYVLFATSIVLLAVGTAGLLGYFDPKYPAELLTIDADSKSLGQIQVNEKRVVPFTFHNHWDQSIWILGSNTC